MCSATPATLDKEVGVSLFFFARVLSSNCNDDDDDGGVGVYFRRVNWGKYE